MSESSVPQRPIVAVPGDVAHLLPALRAALSGAGPVVRPVAPETDPTGLDGTLPTHLAPGEDDDADPTAVVVTTSGSTGTPKPALLSASALLASASATHDRLGGGGRWLLALPAHHIAGVQVLVRALVADRAPRVLDLTGGFSPSAFADACAALPAGRRYTSLVPTQIVRLLDDAAGRRAAAGLDAILVGGAALAPAVHERALAAGLPIVTTYGMSETSGGCVYDGRPLDGVRVRLDDDGRIALGGPTLARGYAGLPGHPAFVEHDGERWFVTDDLGALDGGVLTVLGRADDIIVTGGLKVAPAVVEAALGRLDEVAECAVVGLPDDRWGQVVAAVVVPSGTVSAPLTLPLLHERLARLPCGQGLPREALPRVLALVDRLPLTGPGKPDRAALRVLARSAAEPRA